MMRVRNLRVITAAALLLSLAACNGAETDNAAHDTADFNLTLDMVTFMNHALEPVADVLWRSAGWVDDEVEGYFELYPTDDEGWHEVEGMAGAIVELGNALMLPGRAYDDTTWATYSKAMSEVGLRAMIAAEEQNEEELFQAGAQLYSVCTACHQAYNPEIVTRFAPSSLSD
ncbi:hypothetical protein [Pseudohongiella spirulinae]|uniref:Cytochrome c n=1 Tax=Pseudohongiella spirulinae TaxID=1249552 RepID=A0A0S2KBQ6_9GAMM|nr:hypothetical protein [Pseudohongiella spirulinae]ALO45423.1 hypothetical protein PS2015_746 [Pseudohongiella spirulinae]